MEYHTALTITLSIRFPDQKTSSLKGDEKAINSRQSEESLWRGKNFNNIDSISLLIWYIMEACDVRK